MKQPTNGKHYRVTIIGRNGQRKLAIFFVPPTEWWARRPNLRHGGVRCRCVLVPIKK